MKVLTILGTRPEAIKLAPVILALRDCPGTIQSRVCVTAQHREMVDRLLPAFGIRTDYDLDVMSAGQTPTKVAAMVLDRLDPILAREQPDWVLVQGDTTTVAAASLAAFYGRVRVGHVEAGLRTWDKWQPFPEEINRRVAGVTADLHFAPTEGARSNLIAEGVRPEDVIVTGNTGIDALHFAASTRLNKHDRSLIDNLLGSHETSDVRGASDGEGRPPTRIVLVTAHRRENFGAPIKSICGAIKSLAKRYGEGVRFIYPVHPNPRIQEPVHALLGDVSSVTLLPPLEYFPLVHLMKSSFMVLTDSGGLQEEAPSFGKPVLVLRDVTERPEGVSAGTAKLVGTDEADIVREATRLLDDASAYGAMATAVSPYGDGRASERIRAALVSAGSLR